MQFNSIPFLFCFLPAFLLIFYSIRPELTGVALVLGSFGFYLLASGGNYWWTAVLALVTIASYPARQALAKHPSKWLLALCLGLLTGLLVFFKLYMGGQYLPAGMSFYLFQLAAILIDVYRGRMVPQGGLLCHAQQLVLFPKLLSGPLMDPAELQRQCRERRSDFEALTDGLKTLILGLGLKVVIANRLGGLFGQAAVIGYQSISTGYAWLALIAWAMQLYFDFYGYSLMARGIGKLLGFDLPHNFLDPYAARSVSEFYRRWHITLGAWFREYLYIPLGGNRKGTVRTLLNLAVVWLFTGLWHGVGGSYLLWAGILYFFIAMERLWLGKLLKKTRVLCHVYTILAILISWVPFAVGDWSQMLLFVQRLLGLGGLGVNPRDVIIWGSSYAPILALGAILATPLPRKLWDKLRKHWVSDILMLILFWVVVYFLATSAQDPFLYFQY